WSRRSPTPSTITAPTSTSSRWRSSTWMERRRTFATRREPRDEGTESSNATATSPCALPTSRADGSKGQSGRYTPRHHEGVGVQVVRRLTAVLLLRGAGPPSARVPEAQAQGRVREPHSHRAPRQE